MIRKTAAIVIDVVSVAVIILAAVIMLSVVMTKSGEVPKVGGYSLMCVVSGSMEPDIPVNSLVLVKETDTEEIRKGDVIAFYSRDPAIRDMIVTHRVSEVISRDGTESISRDGTEFRTKGDANRFEDEYTTGGEAVIGRVVFVSPGAGIIMRLSSNPLIFIPLILIPIAVILILNIRSAAAAAREIEKEEQEEALRKVIDKIKENKKGEN